MTIWLLIHNTNKNLITDHNHHIQEFMYNNTTQVKILEGSVRQSKNNHNSYELNYCDTMVLKWTLISNQDHS